MKCFVYYTFKGKKSPPYSLLSHTPCCRDSCHFSLTASLKQRLHVYREPRETLYLFRFVLFFSQGKNGSYSSSPQVNLLKVGASLSASLSGTSGLTLVCPLTLQKGVFHSVKIQDDHCFCSTVYHNSWSIWTVQGTGNKQWNFNL